MDSQSPNGKDVSPAGMELGVMGIFVHQLTVHRAEIFRPLLFYVNQRPLAAAEQKVLDTGQLQVIFFLIRHL